MPDEPPVKRKGGHPRGPVPRYVVSSSVPEPIADSFYRLARARDTTASALLRRLIAHAVRKADGPGTKEPG